MKPEVESLIIRMIREVNKKVLAEAEERGMEIGMKIGTEIGTEIGMEMTSEEIIMRKAAKRFKDQMDIKKLSEITGISIEEIQNL